MHQRGAAYLSLHSPRIPSHTVKHSPEGSKESISLFSFFLSAPENGKRGHNAGFENADHVISHWRGGGICGVKRSSRSTFDLARFSKNSDHVDNTCYENSDHVIIHWS